MQCGSHISQHATTAKRRLERTDDIGRYGALKRSLCRSLLWCRDSDIPTLQRINFPSEGSHPGSHVPSWSWVAYMDGTEYLHPQFGEYDWEEPNSRWSDRDDATAVSDLHRILVATVRRFDLIAAMKVKSDVILGDPGRFRQTRPT